jgi:DUF1365 family protein
MVASAIFRGAVVHTRMKPRRHRLRYQVFSMLFDLDELPELDKKFRLFGHNRWAPLAFFDRDHGSPDDGALRPWVEAQLDSAGICLAGGKIQLLCFPRILGYVFNPLSVYYCHYPGGALAAVLYEVCNTHGERHTYIMPAAASGPVIRQSCDKEFYVSPFIKMDATYHFRITSPQKSVSIVIREDDQDGPILAAAFRGNRIALTAASLTAALAAFPLQSVKVMAGIHWEALLMWFKGFKIYRHQPAAAAVSSSIGKTNSPQTRA